MKKIIGMLLLLVVVFYHIYPPALAIPVVGNSAIFATGGIGLLLYLYHGRPYIEIIHIVFAWLFIGFAYLISSYIWMISDPYYMNNTRSNIAWLFSAYFVVYLYFQVHPRGSFVNFLYYIIAAIVVQGIIALLMYRIPAVDSFFRSIQLPNALQEERMDATEGERLLGYGIAFFGAGVIYGMGLIVTAYTIVKRKYTTLQLFFLCAVYAFIFFVGVLTARTTVVGFFASLILALFVFLMDKSAPKGQFMKFLSFSVIFGIIGYTIIYLYFPEFADWAFELFINYSETGELRTSSSDSIQHMFILPDRFSVWVIGYGTMAFWGSDVGYSRLLIYGGVVGTFAFFFYQFVLAKIAMTKDRSQVFMMLVILGYVLALNVKGLADVNSFLYLFAFYFLYYRYFIYTPKLERLGKFNSTKLRYAVQRPSSDRRLQSDV